MKKCSDVGIGMGVADLSGGQAVLLVMEGIVCLPPLETWIDMEWPKGIYQITVNFGECVQFAPQIVKISG